MTRRLAAFAGVLALVLAPAGAGAYSTGIVELEASQIHGGGGSINGCRCHSSALRPPRTPTQVFITGLPETYEAEASYPIRVWVLGSALPSNAGQPGGTAIAGFSLLVTGGELSPVDDTVRVARATECALMRKEHAESLFASGVPLCMGDDCAVRVRDGGHCAVFEPSNPYCQTCDLASQDPPCRPCDDGRSLAWEATHTAGGSGVSLDPALDDVTIPRTDGNNRFFWDLEWKAPPSGSGRVRINVAGNAANGNGLNDSGDIWNFGERIYLCEAGATCEEPGAGAGH